MQKARLAFCSLMTFLAVFVVGAEVKNTNQGLKSLSRSVPSSGPFEKLTQFCKTAITGEIKSSLSETRADAIAVKSCDNIVAAAKVTCPNSGNTGFKRVGSQLEYGSQLSSCLDICILGLNPGKPGYIDTLRNCNILCIQNPFPI